MTTVTLCVPNNFQPFPVSWSREDNAAALHIGYSAVHYIKSESGLDIVQQDRELVLRQLENVLKGQHREDIDALHYKNSELSKELASLMTLYKTTITNTDELDAKRKVEYELELIGVRENIRCEVEAAYMLQICDLKGNISDLRETVHDLQGSISHSRSSAAERNRAMAVDASDQAKQILDLQKEKGTVEEMLGKCKEELASMKISRVKGAVLEDNLHKTLEDNAFFTISTAEGLHKTRYHDLLVAQNAMLTPCVCPVTAYPVYISDTQQPRCSIENKGHKRGNQLTEQLTKFRTVRTQMEENGTAECFVFIAHSAIPGRSEKISFEITQNGKGYYVATAFIGAPVDQLCAEEIVLTIRAVIAIQSKITNTVRYNHPLSNDLLQEMTILVDGLNARFRNQLSMVDNLTKTSKTLNQQVEGIRLSIVESLIESWDFLISNNVRGKTSETTEMHDSIDSLSGNKRNSTCKLFRNGKDFDQGKAFLTKRKRTE